MILLTEKQRAREAKHRKIDESSWSCPETVATLRRQS